MTIDWGQAGGALTAAGVVVGAIARLWTSIRNKFDSMDAKREAQFNDIKTHVLETFARHEKLDQERHEDNLGRFGDIRVALARLGYRNGNGNAEPPAHHQP